MFTGLIEDVGAITRVTTSQYSKFLTIQSNFNLSEISLGESIAVNGACLTVIEKGTGCFTVEASEESRRRTTVDRLTSNTRVNLERALKMGGRLDGHLVLGHVDGVGEITGIIFRDKTCFMDINGACIEKYLVEKGSIAIDGVSLTLNRVTKNIFQLALIPITLQRTNLQDKKVGHLVNLEGDIIGKYLYKMAAPFVAGSREKGHSGNLSADFLKKHGF